MYAVVAVASLLPTQPTTSFVVCSPRGRLCVLLMRPSHTFVATSMFYVAVKYEAHIRRLPHNEASSFLCASIDTHSSCTLHKYAVAQKKADLHNQIFVVLFAHWIATQQKYQHRRAAALGLKQCTLHHQPETPSSPQHDLPLRPHTLHILSVSCVTTVPLCSQKEKAGNGWHAFTETGSEERTDCRRTRTAHRRENRTTQRRVSPCISRQPFKAAAQDTTE